MNYAQTSPFAEGHWVKVAIKESGVYKLPFDTLRAWGFDDPEHIAVFGNGAEMPQCVNVLYPATYNDTQLKDVAIDLNAGTSENSDSCYLFYAEGPVYFDKKQQTYKFHLWEKKTYYFISNTKQGVRIQSNPKDVGDSLDTLKNYTKHTQDFLINYYSEDLSASERYGQLLLPNKACNIDMPLGNRQPNTLRVLYLEYSNPHTIAEGCIRIASADIDTSISISNNRFSRITLMTQADSLFPTSYDRISITLNNVSDDNEIILNSLTIKNTESIIYSGNPFILILNDDYHLQSNSEQYDSICVFVKTDHLLVRLWDITEKEIPFNCPLQPVNAGFIYPSKRKYIDRMFCFSINDTKIPKLVGELNNIDLYNYPSVNYLIISPPDFIQEAERLAAFRNSFNEISTSVVNVNDIYNLYTSGKKDPSAIRLYIQYLYDKGKGTEDELQYLLLFGHGQCDVLVDDNAVFDKIPVYEADNFADAFYSSISSSNLFYYTHNIAVGRFPVLTIDEAECMVDKTINYEMDNELWKNNITFLADKTDSTLLTADFDAIDVIAEHLFLNQNYYYVNKLYFDAFNNKEAIKDSILRLFSVGQSVVGYCGHSSMSGWANAGFNIDLIKGLTNTKHPIIISHSCHFAEFDNENRCAAEELLLNPKGGAVAVIGGTRNVQGSMPGHIDKNFNYAIAMIDSFDFVGEMFTRSEINNKRVLLGDPCLTFGTNTETIVAKFTVVDGQQVIVGTIQGHENFDGRLYLKFIASFKMEVTLDSSNIPDTIIHRNTCFLIDSTEITNNQFTYEVPNVDVLTEQNSISLFLFASSDNNRNAKSFMPNLTSDISIISNNKNAQLFPIITNNRIQISASEELLDATLFDISGMVQKMGIITNDNDYRIYSIVDIQSGLFFLRLRYRNNMVKTFKILKQ